MRHDLNKQRHMYTYTHKDELVISDDSMKQTFSNLDGNVRTVSTAQRWSCSELWHRVDV